MGIFDKLFGSKIENQKLIEIDFTKNGIVLNGRNNQLPVKISILNEIFGEPEEVKTETNVLYIWQDKGIRGFSKDKENIFEVDIQLIQLGQNQFFPQQPFLGSLKIEGTDYKNFVKVSQNDYLFKEYKIGNSEIQVRLTKEEPKLIRSISIDIQEEEEELTQKEDYKLKKISGEKIEFKDFNFKLAIIEELMYNKELLKPKFDVYEFAEITKIKGFSATEGGYEPIPEVVEYFKELEIDKKFAEQVTEIYQDGGNEIYMNVTPQWDGEDDVFNIQSFEDIKHFPNLKKMTLFETDSKVIEELKSKGIEIKPL
ncbi:DUF6892 domain-containing protein [Pedobacter agri]|uniref:DUF6892 domain-containing protein n=1 Tax=Pedobacter agri TaxID=454586 RepID=UPI00292CC77B|nr:hypothetical protein [Pedobacter agri]